MNQFTFILTRPQMPENIGAAVRGMANFGLSDLRLVAPRDGWPHDDAIPMASGGFDHVQVSVFENLQQALHDCHLSFATTARSRDMQKDVYSPKAAISYRHKNFDFSCKTAIVFGAERTGLTNEEIALCHAIIEAPTSKDFSSLNLAQCVLMMAYEIASFHSKDKPADHVMTPAPLENFNGMFDRFIDVLDHGGFFKESHLRPKIERNIRTMLLRAQMSDNEIKTMHGIISALTRNNR